MKSTPTQQIKIQCLLWLLPAWCAAKPESPRALNQNTARAAVAQLQKSWDAIATFRCRFRQDVYSKQLGGEPDTSEGTLAITKPSRLRWDSDSDGTTSILNEKELIIISKALRRQTRTITIQKQGKESLVPKSLLLLTGKERFQKLYTSEFIEQSPTTITLRLKPRKPGPATGGESYVAEISKDGYLLHALTTETVDSRVVTTFTALELNPELKSELFEYQPLATDIVNRT